jgi:hypothetical protein
MCCTRFQVGKKDHPPCGFVAVTGCGDRGCGKASSDEGIGVKFIFLGVLEGVGTAKLGSLNWAKAGETRIEIDMDDVSFLIGWT